MIGLTASFVLSCIVVITNGFVHVNVPLARSYQGGNELYVNITIGGSALTVQVDSGSSSLVVPTINADGSFPFCDPSKPPNQYCVVGPYNESHATPMTGCAAQVDPKYKQYPMVAENACGFAVEYADGSGLAGALFNDTIHLGGMDARVIVGAGYELIQPFQVQPVAGIMGIGENNCLPSSFEAYDDDDGDDGAVAVDDDDGNDDDVAAGLQCYPTAVADLLRQNDLPDVISICIGEGEEQMSVLTLGGEDPRHYVPDGDAIVVEYSSTDRTYNLNWTGFAAGNETFVDLSSLGASLIIDSGSSSTSLPPDAVKHVFDKINKEGGCNFNMTDSPAFGHCAKDLNMIIDQFSLRFELGDTDGDGGVIIMDGSSYAGCFTPPGQKRQCVVFGLDIGDGILGDNVMRGRHVTYDRDQQVVKIREGRCQSCADSGTDEKDCLSRGNCVFEQGFCSAMANSFYSVETYSDSTTPQAETSVSTSTSLSTSTSASTVNNGTTTGTAKTKTTTATAATSTAHPFSSTSTLTTIATTTTSISTTITTTITTASAAATTASTTPTTSTTPGRLKPGPHVTRPRNPAAPAPSNASQSPRSMGTGAVVGIVIGVLLVISLLVVGVVLTRTNYSKISQSQLLQNDYEDADYEAAEDLDL